MYNHNTKDPRIVNPPFLNLCCLTLHPTPNTNTNQQIVSPELSIRAPTQQMLTRIHSVSESRPPHHHQRRRPRIHPHSRRRECHCRRLPLVRVSHFLHAILGLTFYPEFAPKPPTPPHTSPPASTASSPAPRATSPPTHTRKPSTC
jgi:hypothetical protein